MELSAYKDYLFDTVQKILLTDSPSGYCDEVIGLIEGALVLFLAIWVLRRFGVSFETDTVSATHILRFFATHTPLSALSLLQ